MIQHDDKIYVCMEWLSVCFKFASEISIDKFEIKNLPIQLWNLIKHISIPLVINISILSYTFCCGIPTLLQSDKTTRPPHSGVPKIFPALELTFSVCPTKKSSLLIQKYSHWPKCEFLRLQ
jgi:hypothetical protein